MDTIEAAADFYDRNKTESLLRAADDVPQLVIPNDTHKDQTYFLYPMTQQQLAHTLFPSAELSKDDVRTEAEQRGIHVSNKKDSVGICFIGNIDVHQFLKDRLGKNPGEVVNTHGQVIGRHQGLWFYTIGQRHGFEIDAKTVVEQADGTTIEKHNIPPFYVVAKNADRNQLIVGFGQDVYTAEFHLEDVHWINQPPNHDQVLVRIRHTGQLLPATVDSSNDSWHLKLAESARGVAPGQAAVLYQQDAGQTICLGGGVIVENDFQLTADTS
jgi:tRNA-specific 2-thiouridylase